MSLAMLQQSATVRGKVLKLRAIPLYNVDAHLPYLNSFAVIAQHLFI
jgi:hypothetical protein